VIERILQDLQIDEGWRDTPYRDPLGYWTIGYGFLIDHRKPVHLPKPVGDFWLEYLVEGTWYELVDRIPWIVDQPPSVQRALGNMAYQLGVYGLLRFALMLEALKLGDRDRAADECLDSTYARQTPERARRVAAWIRGSR
jgi:lysozyme